MNRKTVLTTNENLFKIGGNKLIFYIDNSVNREEYRYLDSLIEKNGGINSDQWLNNTINLTILKDNCYEKNKNVNYKFYDVKFIYDSVEKNCLQKLEDYRVSESHLNPSSTFLDDDCTITSSMINEKSNLISDKEYNQTINCSTGEPSCIADDQVSSTQSSLISENLSGCELPKFSPVNNLEPDEDPDSLLLSKPQPNLVINPFYKKKKKVNLSVTNKSLKIKKEMKNDVNDNIKIKKEIPDVTDDIKINKIKIDVDGDVKIKTENINDVDDDFKLAYDTYDCDETIFETSNDSLGKKLSTSNNSNQHDNKFIVVSIKKEKTEDIDEQRNKKDDFVEIKIDKTQEDQHDESLDLLDPRNTKSLLIIDKNKLNKNNLDSLNKFDDIEKCRNINNISIEEIHSPDFFESFASTDEDILLTSNNKNKNKTLKTTIISSDNEIINTPSKISGKKERKEIVAKKSRQINCQDSDEPVDSIKRKKKNNQNTHKTVRIFGSHVAREIDLPSSSSDDNDEYIKSTPRKRARYYNKKESTESNIVIESPSSSSDNDDDKSEKSNSSSYKSTTKLSSNNNNKSCSSSTNIISDNSSSESEEYDTKKSNDHLTKHQISKINHNQKIAANLNINDNKIANEKKSWMNGQKLCFSTDYFKQRIPNLSKRKIFLKWEENEMIRHVYNHKKFEHSRSRTFWAQLCDEGKLLAHRDPTSVSSHWRRVMLTPEYVESSELPQCIKDLFLCDHGYRKLKGIYDLGKQVKNII